MNDVEFCLEPGCHPGRPAQQRIGSRSRGDGHHDAFTGLPHHVGLVPPQMLQEFLVGLVGQEPQRQLPQGDQVVGAEEVGKGLGDLLLRVDVAVQHPAAQLLRRGVDQLDLVGFAHYPVRHPLTDTRPGHVLDLVGDALQVLDVDRGDDVDPGGEDLHNVLPALFVPAGSRHVRVGELIDQGDLGVPAQHRVQVHLLQAAAPVFHQLARDDLQVTDHLLGQPPTVTLDKPDDDAGSPLLAPVALVEHCVGLADAGGRAEVDPEVPGRFHHAGGVADDIDLGRRVAHTSHSGHHQLLLLAGNRLESARKRMESVRIPGNLHGQS